MKIGAIYCHILLMGPMYLIAAYFFFHNPLAIVYAAAIIALVIWGRNGENHAKK